MTWAVKLQSSFAWEIPQASAQKAESHRHEHGAEVYQAYALVKSGVILLLVFRQGLSSLLVPVVFLAVMVYFGNQKADVRPQRELLWKRSCLALLPILSRN